MKTSHDIGKGITVTVRDRDNNKSKSFTVYSEDFEKVFEVLKSAAQRAKE